MKRYDSIKQGTPEWEHIRKGKITGTTLKSIMGRADTRKMALYEIVAERLTVGVPEGYENAMDRGTRLEPEARAMFELETGLKVEQTGLCESEQDGNIVNSPDGLIGDDMAAEFKCLSGKYHVEMWLTGEVPSDYRWQVVQYFVVNDKLKKLYFVCYNPDIPIHPLHILEINRNDVAEDIEKAQQEEQKFLEEVNNILEKIIPYE